MFVCCMVNIVFEMHMVAIPVSYIRFLFVGYVGNAAYGEYNMTNDYNNDQNSYRKTEMNKLNVIFIQDLEKS